MSGLNSTADHDNVRGERCKPLFDQAENRLQARSAIDRHNTARDHVQVPNCTGNAVRASNPAPNPGSRRHGKPPAAAAVHAETARQKVRMAEDAWNTRDPERVSLAYTRRQRWRNRAEFLAAATRSSRSCSASGRASSTTG